MNSGPPLVLIVDDNDRNRKLVVDVLRFAGLRTVEAATARNGLALAAEYLPDVILLDLRLPDLAGTEALRALRDDPRTSRIAVVAMTALPLGNEDAWLVETGFAGYIAKPIDIDTLPDLVTRFATREAE